jgi:hypothetical protein
MCLRAFLTLDNFELNTLAFCQGTITGATDLAVVDENIATRVALNETITLSGVKPLDSAILTLCHVFSSSFVKKYDGAG